VIVCKSPAELERMRAACELVADVLGELRAMVAPGVTTADLDSHAEAFVRRRGGVPAFKGYHGFPATLCTSVNEEVIHGIPGRRALVDGDIVSIDVGVVVDGFYGDAAISVPVGRIDERTADLLRVTEESLYRGIEQAVVGARVSDIGTAVQRHVEAYGFSVVREFVGHGVGTALHEEPQVPNYGPPGRGPRLAEGMTLAIEPMVAMGKSAVRVLGDGWTAVTKDRSLSAHFEHTIAVTAGGPVIMTVPSGSSGPGAPIRRENIHAEGVSPGAERRHD
jgi:methionyl aminopeptidase